MAKPHPDVLRAATYASKKYGVPYNVLLAVGNAESGLQPLGYHKYTETGEPDLGDGVGAWGVTVGTGKGLGFTKEQLEDPSQQGNAEASAKYLRQLYNRYGNWYDASMAYRGPKHWDNVRSGKASPDAIDEARTSNLTSFGMPTGPVAARTNVSTPRNRPISTRQMVAEGTTDMPTNPLIYDPSVGDPQPMDQNNPLLRPVSQPTPDSPPGIFSFPESGDDMSTRMEKAYNNPLFHIGLGILSTLGQRGRSTMGNTFTGALEGIQSYQSARGAQGEADLRNAKLAELRKEQQDEQTFQDSISNPEQRKALASAYGMPEERLVGLAKLPPSVRRSVMAATLSASGAVEARQLGAQASMGTLEDDDPLVTGLQAVMPDLSSQQAKAILEPLGPAKAAKFVGDAQRSAYTSQNAMDRVYATQQGAMDRTRVAQQGATGRTAYIQEQQNERQRQSLDAARDHQREMINSLSTRLTQRLNATSPAARVQAQNDETQRAAELYSDLQSNPDKYNDVEKRVILAEAVNNKILLPRSDVIPGPEPGTVTNRTVLADPTGGASVPLTSTKTDYSPTVTEKQSGIRDALKKIVPGSKPGYMYRVGMKQGMQTLGDTGAVLGTDDEGNPEIKDLPLAHSTYRYVLNPEGTYSKALRAQGLIGDKPPENIGRQLGAVSNMLNYVIAAQAGLTATSQEVIRQTLSGGMDYVSDPQTMIDFVNKAFKSYEGEYNSAKNTLMQVPGVSDEEAAAILKEQGFLSSKELWGAFKKSETPNAPKQTETQATTPPSANTSTQKSPPVQTPMTGVSRRSVP